MKSRDPASFAGHLATNRVDVAAMRAERDRPDNRHVPPASKTSFELVLFGDAKCSVPIAGRNAGADSVHDFDVICAYRSLRLRLFHSVATFVSCALAR
jgi:hypothetical protein